MTDTAHTPTWEVSHDAVPEGFTQETIYDGETGERIATVFVADAIPLIKAAPALLAALEAMREAFGYEAFAGPDCPKCEAFTMADAAIAEAEATA